MSKKIIIKEKLSNYKINNFKVSGDKSISIRWVLLSSLSSGICKSSNLLMSEDVLAAIEAIKKLGVRCKLNKKECIIYGKGIDGYNYKKNIVINSKNSGTLGRLIIGLLANTKNKIKIIGDKSLSKRDFKRISDPISKFGVKFNLTKNQNLPLSFIGNQNLKPIRYLENRGSAQCKSAVIFAAFRANGITHIKAKKSRDHTELLCKSLGLPIKYKKTRKFDFIQVNKLKNIKPINYKIPSDISSAAFFLVLTVLSDNSQIKIKNVNINSSRTGILKIFNMMGIKYKLSNKKKYKGEAIADIFVESTKKIKSINCPTKFNSETIDEFLLIFLLAAKAKGISTFNKLGELDKKESPRLKWGAKILKKMGVKIHLKKESIKIFGNQNLNIENKKIIIKNYLKDHRVFMTSVVAALSLGGEWHIHDKDSTNTSFPDFLEKINLLLNEKKN